MDEVRKLALDFCQANEWFFSTFGWVRVNSAVPIESIPVGQRVGANWPSDSVAPPDFYTGISPTTNLNETMVNQIQWWSSEQFDHPFVSVDKEFRFYGAEAMLREDNSLETLTIFTSGPPNCGRNITIRSPVLGSGFNIPYESDAFASHFAYAFPFDPFLIVSDGRFCALHYGHTDKLFIHDVQVENAATGKRVPVTSFAVDFKQVSSNSMHTHACHVWMRFNSQIGIDTELLIKADNTCFGTIAQGEYFDCDPEIGETWVEIDEQRYDPSSLVTFSANGNVMGYADFTVGTPDGALQLEFFPGFAKEFDVDRMYEVALGIERSSEHQCGPAFSMNTEVYNVTECISAQFLVLEAGFSVEGDVQNMAIDFELDCPDGRVPGKLRYQSLLGGNQEDKEKPRNEYRTIASLVTATHKRENIWIRRETTERVWANVTFNSGGVATHLQIVFGSDRPRVLHWRDSSGINAPYEGVVFNEDIYSEFRTEEGRFPRPETATMADVVLRDGVYMFTFGEGDRLGASPPWGNWTCLLHALEFNKDSGLVTRLALDFYTERRETGRRWLDIQNDWGWVRLNSSLAFQEISFSTNWSACNVTQMPPPAELPYLPGAAATILRGSSAVTHTVVSHFVLMLSSTIYMWLW